MTECAGGLLCLDEALSDVLGLLRSWRCEEVTTTLRNHEFWLERTEPVASVKECGPDRDRAAQKPVRRPDKKTVVLGGRAQLGRLRQRLRRQRVDQVRDRS